MVDSRDICIPDFRLVPTCTPLDTPVPHSILSQHYFFPIRQLFALNVFPLLRTTSAMPMLPEQASINNHVHFTEQPQIPDDLHTDYADDQ